MNNKFSIRNIILTKAECAQIIMLVPLMYGFLIPSFRMLSSELLIKHHQALIGRGLVNMLIVILSSLFVYIWMLNICINRYNYICSYEKLTRIKINTFPKIYFLAKMVEIILTSYTYLFLWIMSYTEVISLGYKNKILIHSLWDNSTINIILIIIIISILLKTVMDILGLKVCCK